MRSREATSDTILDALDALVLEGGVAAAGVNAVARRAGVSKVLIYRYFESFEGLLEAWALRNTYWTGLRPELPAGLPIAEAVGGILAGQAASLRRDRRRREVLRWLVAEKSAVGDKVMARIEKTGVETTRFFAERTALPEGSDPEALMALITAGISHLALMADRCDVYNGVRLDGDEGWARLLRAAREAVSRALETR